MANGYEKTFMGLSGLHTGDISDGNRLQEHVRTIISHVRSGSYLITMSSVSVPLP